MTFNKFIAPVFCVLISISLVSCQKTDEAPFSSENPTTVFQKNTDSSATSSDTSAKNSETSSQDTASSSAEKKSSAVPSDWDKAQVIEFYKRAASASDKEIVSEQNITLQEFTISGGSYERLFKIITPAMTKFLSDLSSPKSGITGEISLLNEADAKSAKAYTIGENTAVELVLYDQSSGIEADPKNNSVGHGITTVKDVGTVIDGMKLLGIPLEISEDNVKINYTNAMLRVLIDKEGKITNGTWSYRATINLSNYAAFGQTMPSTRVVLDNVISVNGGF